MGDYVMLHGAEEVRRAASVMESSASEFQRAIGQFDFIVNNLMRSMEEHASRIEQALSKGESS